MNDVISAWIIGLGVTIVTLLIAVLITNSISYDIQNKGASEKKRKVCFWVMADVTPEISFGLAYVLGYMSKGLIGMAKHQAYMNDMYIASAVSFVLFVVLGFILSKVFKTSKIGSWF